MSTIWSLLSRRPASVRRAPKPPSRRLHLEILEDRLAPAAHIGSETFATIQGAVNAANAGAVITVDPGTYNGQVTVNKSVTIEGANAGINGASTNRTSESSVTWAKGPTFLITASNVTIDGFTVGDMNTPSDYLGILITGGVSGTHIQDNIIENNGGGIGLANGSGGQAVIQDNLIRANSHDLPGSSQSTVSVPGNGIYSDPDVAGGSLQNVLIQYNTFSANGSDSYSNGDDIQLAGFNPSQGVVSDITISNNWGDGGIILSGTTNATISGNSIVHLGPTLTVTGAIDLDGGDSNINISNNVLKGLEYGVLISNYPSSIPPNSNVTVNDNSITNNLLGGLRIYATGTGTLATVSYSGVLNASGNWWGSATGPTTPDNPGGSGTAIDDPYHQVVFTPWLNSGANNAAPGQPGFYGDQGSLSSSNPAPTTGGGGSSGGGGNVVSTLQQQVLNDLVVAQQFQGDLQGLGQQLSAWFMLASQQSLDDALTLLFDEAALTAGSVLVVQESQLGMHDAALLSAFDSLESAIQANPLASTQAGQQVIALTGALVAAKLQ